MTVTVLALPPIGDGNPDSAEFYPWANTLTSTSPLTRDQQTIAYPGVLWRCRFEYPVLDEEDGRMLAAWLAAMQGSAGRVNLGPPHGQQPQGQAAPTEWFFTDDTGFDDGYGFFDPPHDVVIRDDVASSKILFRTEGWGASETVLKAGDYVSWSNRSRRMMAILAKDAVSDGSGNADLRLAFPAPEIPPAGLRVYPWWPTVTMRLVDDDQAQQNWSAPLFSQHSFEAIEAKP